MYDMTWRYAEFAVGAGWLAPALEVTAFALLLLVVIRTPLSEAFRKANGEDSGQRLLTESVR